VFLLLVLRFYCVFHIMLCSFAICTAFFTSCYVVLQYVLRFSHHVMWFLLYVLHFSHHVMWFCNMSCVFSYCVMCLHVQYCGSMLIPGLHGHRGAWQRAGHSGAGGLGSHGQLPGRHLPWLHQVREPQEGLRCTGT